MDKDDEKTKSTASFNNTFIFQFTCRQWDLEVQELGVKFRYAYSTANKFFKV